MEAYWGEGGMHVKSFTRLDATGHRFMLFEIIYWNDNVLVQECTGSNV